MATDYSKFKINIEDHKIDTTAAKFWKDATKKRKETISFLYVGKVSEEAIKVCIELAAKDLMLRTLKANDKNSKANLLADLTSDKDGSLFKCIKTYCDFLIDYSEKYCHLSDLFTEEFDRWHNDACISALMSLNQYYKVPKGKSVRYGKAQKIVNMTFKYLFCLFYSDSVDGKLNREEQHKYHVLFRRCHMPLDSFIIEWIYRETRKIKDLSFIKDNCPSWSNLNYEEDESLTLKNIKAGGKKYIHSYKNILGIIDIILKENYYEGYSHLEAELFIWQEMQLHLSTEAFIFALRSSYEELDNKEKEKIKYSDIASKTDEVTKAINKYIRVKGGIT